MDPLLTAGEIDADEVDQRLAQIKQAPSSPLIAAPNEHSSPAKTLHVWSVGLRRSTYRRSWAETWGSKLWARRKVQNNVVTWRAPSVDRYTREGMKWVPATSGPGAFRSGRRTLPNSQRAPKPSSPWVKKSAAGPLVNDGKRGSPVVADARTLSLPDGPPLPSGLCPDSIAKPASSGPWAAGRPLGVPAETMRTTSPCGAMNS